MTKNDTLRQTKFSRLLKSPRLWATFFTLGDQLVNSGSNFLMGIIAGRLLSIGSFGEFSLGMTLLIFSLILQDTLLASPYTYHFHHANEQRRRSLRAGAIIQCLLLSAVSILALLVVIYQPIIEIDKSLRSVLLTLVCAMPFLFLRECLRRIFFTELKMAHAFFMDCAVCVLQFALIAAVWWYGWLSSPALFGAFSVAAMLGALAGFIATRAEFDFKTMDVKGDTRENVLYGRWLLAGSACHLSGLYAYPWLIYALYGKEEAGAFAACYTLVNLLNPVILGFNNYFRSKIIAAKAHEGVAAMDALVRKACLILFIPGAAISLGMALGGDALVQLVYGGEFTGLGAVLGIIGLSVMAITVNAPLQLGTLALGKPQYNLYFHAAGASVMLLCGVPLTIAYAKTGAAIGYVLTVTTSLAVLTWLYMRDVRQSSRRS